MRGVRKSPAKKGPQRPSLVIYHLESEANREKTMCGQPIASLAGCHKLGTDPRDLDVCLTCRQFWMWQHGEAA